MPPVKKPKKKSKKKLPPALAKWNKAFTMWKKKNNSTGMVMCPKKGTKGHKEICAIRDSL